MAALPRESFKALRQRMGAPFRDVKFALESSGGAEAAVVALRRQREGGVSQKEAPEGLLAVASGHGATVVLEINSESELVAGNEMFRHLATRVARAAFAQKSAPGSAFAVDLPALEAVKIKLEHEKLSGEATVQEAVANLSSVMGESIRLRRGFLVSSTTGIVPSLLACIFTTRTW